MSEPATAPDTRPDGMPSDEELLTKIGKWESALNNHWSDWRKEARGHYDMYAGRQWDKEDEDAIKEANRQPVTINRTATIIDAVSGAEIMGRQEAAYFPREVGDSAVNEVLTKGAEWVRDQTDADFEESEATRDAFICGMGWVETRMDYEEDSEGKIVIERVDPLEMWADPSHRKPGCADGHYLKRAKPMAEDDFERLWPGKTGVRTAEEARTRSINHAKRYQDGDVEVAKDDEVIVCEWQWYDVHRVGLITDPSAPSGVRQVEKDEADALESGGGKVVRINQRRYYRAFTAGEQVLSVELLPDKEFTYKAITGKRDRNKGVWFGLMRLMRDPQKFANAFFTQILHIIQTTSKGGVMAEDGAIDDIKAFEDSYAKADIVTLVPAGALATGKIQPKPATPYPQGLDRLMEMAITAIRDSTGVNQELLGLVERDQAGVLEDQRKQAAYGILAAFFDSIRRYRRAQGGLLLKLMRSLPDGWLARIVGENGEARYVQMAMDPNTAKYDVIVDEAPTSPDQKRKVWAAAQQLMPVLKDAGQEVWMVLADYSPLPASVVAKLKKVMQAQMEPPAPDPLVDRGKEAGVSKVEGEAREAHGKADLAEAEAIHMQTFGPVAAMTDSGPLAQPSPIPAL